MKIEIRKTGNLSIERAGYMKDIYCPFSRRTVCGDWCPLFGEPAYYKVNSHQTTIDCRVNTPEEADYIQLTICQGKIFNLNKQTFADRRK